MKPKRTYTSGILWITAFFIAVAPAGGSTPDVYAGSPAVTCRVNPMNQCGATRSVQPRCAIELTCTDTYVTLGRPDGVCFRATCPGIWALIHRCEDQRSFRRRYFTYRHYAFVGYWDLKDQGVIETGPTPARELFLVLPDDLVEITMTLPDCNARIEVKNLGYVKKGTVCELKKWLAQQMYQAEPALMSSYRNGTKRGYGSSGFQPQAPWNGFGAGFLNGLGSTCRSLGLPF